MTLGSVLGVLQVSLVLWGVCIARSGLKTWRKQLIGNQDHELARRILIGTLQLRDSLQSVRNPFMSSGEIGAALKAHNLEDKHAEAQKEKPFDTTFEVQAAYAMRWDSVLDSRRDLQIAVIEAEAVWGKEFPKIFESVWELQAKLYGAITGHLRMMSGKPGSSVNEAHWNKIEAILYSESTRDNADAFSKDLEAAVARVKEAVHPKLINGPRHVPMRA